MGSAAAEEAYREASRHGLEPQPGLALLRLDRATATLPRPRSGGQWERPPGVSRARPCCPRASRSCWPPATSTRRGPPAASWTRPRHDRAATCSRHGRRSSGARRHWPRATPEALIALRRAWRLWNELGAPYEAARVRVQVGLACRALGDEDTAALELEAARGVFERLGAAPDLARLDALIAGAPPKRGLTARELEVLRLVVPGRATER